MTEIMEEKVYIMSDIEMGRGDITDDFCDDDTVTDFINTINKDARSQKKTLVLNGDIFDFLKMAYKDHYPRYITEEISLWKLEEVIKKHGKVFDVLKIFLKNPDHFLFFVIGNHDADLVWPALQRAIRKKLDNSKNIDFDFWYKKNDLHAEHGHLVDYFYSLDTKRPIITYKKQEILNLPWGAQACFNYLVNLKKKFPEEERTSPKLHLFKQNKIFKKESKKTAIRLAFKEVLLNPVIHFRDPTYRVPYRKFLKHIFYHGFEVIDDQKFIKRYVREVAQKNPDKRILVLGHAHLFGEFHYKNQRCLVTDTWRNERDITQNLQKKKKSFVEITYQNGRLQNAELKTFDEK